MIYDYDQKKIVVVLSSKLKPSVALNVVGHLAISVGAYAEKDIMGRPELLDASGAKHIGISKYPVIVTKVRPTRLARLIHDAKLSEDILVVDYPEQMLTTGHDDDLASALSGLSAEEIEYLGAILYGTREVVDTLTGNFTLWD